MKANKRLTEKDFRLLLTFLHDKSEGTVTLAKNQLQAALKRNPRFSSIIKEVHDPRLKRTAEDFLEELRYQNVQSEFQTLFKASPKIDLERGLFLLAKMEFPKLRPVDIGKPLDEMAAKIDKMLSKEVPLPTRPISAMRRFLFDMQKFHGDDSNYYDPDNLFLNQVLSSKTGMPITLCCIYLLVSWRLKLLVQGIGLPGHFIVGHRIPRGMVFIDPFNGGKILRVKDCEMLVRRLGIPFKQSYLDPIDNVQILARVIVNLINIYNDQGQTSRAHWLAQLFQLMQG